jgi:hypothetical protein
MNYVDESNFNETCKGYLKRAIKIMHENDSEYEDNMTEEMEQRLFNGLRWAFDEMTFENAREEYNK